MTPRSYRISLARRAAMKTAIAGSTKCEKKPVPPPPSPPPTHGSLPLNDARDYLQRIYTAIDQIYRSGNPKPKTPRRPVCAIIIQARCARVLAQLQANGSVAYLAATTAAIPFLNGQAQFIAQQMLRIGQNGVTMRRFSDFVDRFGFVLLSVCAHSKSFRVLLDSDSLAPGSQTLWQDLCDLIESHAHSIELYARTRGLDWNTPLTEGSREGSREDSNAWDQLICQLLYDVLDQHSHFRETEVLGISDTEYNIRHELPDSISHYHEWVVALGLSTAYNPTMTYQTGKGKTSRLVTERQVNIDASIILDNSDRYKWQNRSAWPIDDPRYRGPVSAPCEVCPDDSGKRTVAPQRCGHTLAQLCRLHHSKIEKSSSRVELLQYPAKGVGVRALKAFRYREILAEYVGEIYPGYVIRGGRKVSVELYPHPDGISYRYEQSLEDLAVNDDQENTKKKTTSPNRQCRTMIIDPSIKGNWPRYMSHSCRPATLFEYRFVGDKLLTLIVANRNIQFDEELTIDYGLDYWQAADYGCACGEDRCTLWDPVQNKAKGETKVTWGQEKERRTAEPELEPEPKPEVADQVNKKPEKKVAKKPDGQGKKEQKMALTKRRKGTGQDDGQPTKKARNGVRET